MNKAQTLIAALSGVPLVRRPQKAAERSRIELSLNELDQLSRIRKIHKLQSRAT